MLVAICATSVILVDQARQDSGWVVHTVEVENQISTVLLQVRRAESAARGYLLTSEPRFLTEHQATVATILPDVDKLAALTTDNPVQIENAKRLRAPVERRLQEFARAIDFVKRNDIAGGVAMLRETGATESVEQMNSIANAMRAEENELFVLRTATADRTQRLAAIPQLAATKTADISARERRRAGAPPANKPAASETATAVVTMMRFID